MSAINSLIIKVFLYNVKLAMFNPWRDILEWNLEEEIELHAKR